MIVKELENIVRMEREKGRRENYIKNALKEYLQVYLLFFVYTSPQYSKNLIFTGGTCLRHFYDLDRFSEDVDFDFIDNLDAAVLAKEAALFFDKKYKYSDVSISLKQQGRQLLFKFPVLEKLGLAGTGASGLLYVKMDISKLPSRNYALITSSQNKYGFNYVAKHYDLPDLMAGKMHAILKRRFLRGAENRESLRGRDYFDLLWFIKKGVRPNVIRLSDMLGEKVTLEEAAKRVDKKVQNLENYFSDFCSDMEPLIAHPETMKLLVENYSEEYFRNREKSFGPTL